MASSCIAGSDYTLHVPQVCFLFCNLPMFTIAWLLKRCYQEHVTNENKHYFPHCLFLMPPISTLSVWSLSLSLSQNELSVLEFIHAIVETFDRYFESVVSLLVFSPSNSETASILKWILITGNRLTNFCSFSFFAVWIGCILITLIQEQCVYILDICTYT